MVNLYIKAKWIEALRSGKYKKGQAKLRSTKNEFCALGVLCDVIDPSKWVKPTSQSMYKDCYLWEGRIGGIPTSFLTEIGMTAEFAEKISILNDTPSEKRNEFLYDFDLLANIIEMEWT